MATALPSPSHRRPPVTVQARIIANMLMVASRAGLDRNALVHAAGIQDVDLDDPDARVALSTQIALWQLIASQTTDPGIGINAGLMPLKQRGLLGYTMCYSGTLGAALRRLVRFGRIFSEAVQYELEKDRQHVAIAQCHPALGAGLPYAVDSRLAALVHGCREITGVHVVPVEVSFAYRRPSSTAPHARFFQCPLRFDQPVSKVTLHARDLDLRVPRGDEQLAGYLSDHAQGVLHSLLAGSSITERVRSAIWARLGEGRPTLAQIATVLELPARTLQRHLAREGTSVHEEVERIRKAMATASLSDRSTSIEEVAFVLGYTEPSTFYRSFKRWTGTTPRQYRMAAA